MQLKADNRYVSCDWVHSGIEFRHNSIRTCCFAYLQNQKEPYSTLIENYQGEKINWEEFLGEKKRQREMHKKNDCFPTCKGCIYLHEKDWDEDFYIDHITFNHWSKCNCNCTYCYTNDNKTASNEFKHYSIFPVVKDMFDRKILRATPTSCVTFGGGEPSILEEFDETLELFLSNGFNNIRIDSSGIKYSKSMEKGLQLGAISLTISTDSGSKETYEKIKRVPCFEIVWENIKKYSSNQKSDNLLKVKYIIIPEVNDNKEEIDKWFDLVIKNKVKAVAVSVEQNWYFNTIPNFSKDVYEKIKYIENKANELNLNIEIYCEAISLIKKYDENNK